MVQLARVPSAAGEGTPQQPGRVTGAARHTPVVASGRFSAWRLTPLTTVLARRPILAPPQQRLDSSLDSSGDNSALLRGQKGAG